MYVLFGAVALYYLMNSFKIEIMIKSVPVFRNCVFVTD